MSEVVHCWTRELSTEKGGFVFWDHYPAFFEESERISEGELPEIWFWEAESASVE